MKKLSIFICALAVAALALTYAQQTDNLPPPLPVVTPIIPGQPDGPNIPGHSEAYDVAIGHVEGTIVDRVSTNWAGGTTRKVGQHEAHVLGQVITIPIYLQTGNVSKSTVINFVYNGQVYSYHLKTDITATVTRQFRMEGTTPVFFTNTVTSRPLP